MPVTLPRGDASTAPATPGQTDAAHIFVYGSSMPGCFSNSDGRTAVTVWCEAPHGYETLYVEPLPEAPYSVDAIDATTAERCEDAFAGLVGEQLDGSGLAIERVLPSRDAWESGDRVVLCAVYKPDSFLNGTLTGA